MISRMNLALLLVLIIAGCASQPIDQVKVAVTSSPTVTLTTSAIATETPAFTKTVTAQPTLTPTPTISLEQAKEELTVLFNQDEQAEINLFPLKTPQENSSMWVIYLQKGDKYMETLISPLIALYHRTDTTWQEIERVGFQDIPAYYVSVTQLETDLDELWLIMDTVDGAHSGCTQILTFKDQSFNVAYWDCRSHIPVAKTSEWGGKQTIVIDQTDDYVFGHCYACQMRDFHYEVLQIQKDKLVTFSIEQLPDSAAATLHRLNNRAVELAQAKLWQQAQETINQAVLFDKQDKTLQRNAMIINLHANAFQRQAKNEDSYPLLGNIFYGDYEATLQIMRPYSVTTLFDPETPLIKGTKAEMYQADLAQAITETVTVALQVEPNLAEAYFLRAWATYLITPTNPAILADLRQAARLSPNESLFSNSVTHFSQD